ncbi:MAG TPA: glycosyltransferase family 1 protein [Acidobacteria bacterium]|nr:glycosyltransferase family 1 protein [Acidobacteriota bacterium]
MPVVATLHDVIPLRYPGAIPSRRVRHRAVQRLGTCRRATLVHAVSRATARDAVHALGLDPARVRVVHNGVSLPAATPSEEERDHVLYVGGADPHKRVDLLLAAWQLPGTERLPPLVIAGGAVRRPDAIAAASRYPSRIRLAGVVDDGELDRLYRRAVAVLMPSLWEGYGLPVVEGMARGAVPVVTARASLPEVGADAALHVSASAGPGAWIAAVRRLVEEPELRSRLVVRGRELGERRSWDRCAEKMVELYREARARWRTARS